VRSEDGVELRPSSQIQAMDLLDTTIAELLRGPETKLGGIGRIPETELARQPASGARLILALSRANLVLRESRKDQPAETEALLRNAEDLLSQARGLMRGLGNHPELPALRELEAKVIELATIRFSSDIR